MSLMPTHVLGGILLGLALATPRSAAPNGTTDCATMIRGYLDWMAGSRLRDGDHAVGAKLATVKIQQRNPDTYPWGHESVSEGRMGWHGDDMTGRFTVVFSDRRTPGTQARFAPAKSDLQDITAFADGRVRVMLRSWGDASIWLEDVQCYKDGFMTGINREGNGVSMMAFALRNEIMHSDRDGFRAWP